MSKSVPLSTETKDIELIIDFPECKVNQDIINRLETYLKNNSVEYFFILHDRDILPEGEFKVPHLHVLYKIQKRRILKTSLNHLCKNISLNTLLVSITKWSDYNGRIQYLIHKNNPEKISYKVSEIHTNAQDLDVILERQLKTEISIEYLIYLVQKFNSKIEIYNEIGLHNTQRYHWLIAELWQAKMNDTLRTFSPVV